jgi:hypothetical protein
MPPQMRRIITGLTHGGHALTEELAEATPGTAEQTTVEVATNNQPEPADVRMITTRFDYLFDGLRYPEDRLPIDSPSTVVTGLKALGSAMVDQSEPDSGDSSVPPIYTYWGQFVDHDLTAATDSDNDISITELPLVSSPPSRVVKTLRNLREPTLNLDSLYGNGPGAVGPKEVPFTGGKFDIGPTTTPAPEPKIPGDDLPRAAGAVPLVGDTRNDENLIVAQLHLGFLKFHNAVVEYFADHPGDVATGDGSFGRARQVVQWHYQWVTVHDFLATLADQPTLTGLLDGSIVPLFAPRNGAGSYMPLEFSAAAYRFGHSMVRGTYDWNANFGAPGDEKPHATFGEMFRFTGGGGMVGRDNLPENWPSQFERMTGHEPRPAGTGPDTPPRAARKIDTHIAPPLGFLVNQDNPSATEEIRRVLRRLAVRNLLRGYRLAIPTGQAIATALGIKPLTSDELLSPRPASDVPNPVADALLDGGFVDRTPLWFYVLKEAELGGGDRLGPVGSRIVCETIVGQLRNDTTSFLSSGWTPADGVKLVGPDGSRTEVDTIIRFLRFAGVHP